MNIVVVCADAFRYAHLGFLGRQEVVTPNLDRMAREGASFEDFGLCSFPKIVNRIEAFMGRCTFPFFDWGPLRSWLENLQIPPAQRQQLLQAARFHWLDRIRERFFKWRSRWSYLAKYRHYGRNNGGTNSILASPAPVV